MGILGDLAENLYRRIIEFAEIGIVLEQFRFQQRLKIEGKSAVLVCRAHGEFDGVAGKMDESRKLALERDFDLGSSETLRRGRYCRHRREAGTSHDQEP